MQVALCMIVLNEEAHVVECIAPIRDLVDQVVVVDTGSTDRTVELLVEELGIEPIPYGPRTGEFDYGAARNFAQSHVRTPWILRIDADERVAPEAVRLLSSLPDDPGVSGYFGGWRTAVGGQWVGDYKLFAHRSDLSCLGVIHESQQVAIRDRGERAVWLEGLEVRHEQRPGEVESVKQRERLRRLLTLIESEPDWYRYHWFAGAACFRQGDLKRAVELLETAAGASSARFPVECLNSGIVLSEIHARSGRRAALDRTLRRALDFLESVSDDFEVRVNSRVRPWLLEATEFLARGREAEIRSYAFGR